MMIKKIIFLLIWILPFGPHEVRAGRVFSFDGEMDLVEKSARFRMVSNQQEVLGFVIRSEGPGRLDVFCDCQHLKTPYFDLSSKFEARIQWDPASGKKTPSSLSGSLLSQYTLLDFKPTREMTSRFEIKNGRLTLHSFNFSGLAARGSLDLKKPFACDLNFGLYDIPMEPFLDFWVTQRKYSADGLVSGTINVSGKQDRLYLNGILESANGFIKKLHFNKIRLEAQGFFPQLAISRMLLTQADGMSYNITGSVDLSDKENFPRQIKALSLSPILADSEAQAQWTIKRRENDKTGNLELKYLIRETDDAGFSDTQSSDMFGVQKTLQF